MLSGQILGNNNELKGSIQAQVINNGGGGGIEIDGAAQDKGFLRFKGSNAHFETILPDSEVTAESENIVSSGAVANYLNKNYYNINTIDNIVAQVDKSFYPKDYIDGIVQDVSNTVDNIREVAEGKTDSYTVDTLSDLGTLLNINTSVVQDEYSFYNTSIFYNGKTHQLRQGDIIWVVDTGVPDYWVSVDNMKIYKMETTKIDLATYVTYDQYQSGFSGLANTVYQNQSRIATLEGQQVTLTQAQYDALVTNGTVNENVYYNIVEG